jgi:hypothetical protein
MKVSLTNNSQINNTLQYRYPLLRHRFCIDLWPNEVQNMHF